jgi:hypothetical protein
MSQQEAQHIDRTVPDRPAHNVDLRIERLVVDGIQLNGAQAAQMRVAMQTELSRLLAGGLPHSLPAGATPRLRAPDLLNFDSSNSSELGRRVGQTVYKSLISRL